MRNRSARWAFAFGVIVMGAALTGDSIGHAQIVTGAPQAPAPQILWRAEVGFQPIDIQAGDITGDGRPDLVIGYSLRGTPGPSIVAIDSSGQILWRFQTEKGVWNVAIGDIDGDGINDVAGYDNQLPSFLYAIKNDGTLLWKAQLPITGSGNEIGDHVKIADVTGDGRNEVIVGPPGSSIVSIFNKEGVFLYSYSVPASGVAAIPFIEVADLSGDGVKDILISYGYQCPPCGIRVMDGSGSLLWDFPNTVRFGNAAIGDIDSDGKPDAVVSEFFGTKVSAISNLGSLLWTLPLQGDTTTVALADVKGKGKGSLNVVAGSGTKVNLMDAGGKLLWTLEANANVFKVLFGEFKRGGGKGIAAATMGERTSPGGVLFVDSRGKLKGFLAGDSSAPTENVGFRDLVVADLDGDGIDEVVAISEDGFAYALQMFSKPKQ